jgi:hypothetical protein
MVWMWNLESGGGDWTKEGCGIWKAAEFGRKRDVVCRVTTIDGINDYMF